MFNQKCGLKEMLLKTVKGREDRQLPGLKYVGYEEFVLANGKQFTAGPFPTEYQDAKSKEQDCHRNAFYLADEYPHKLKYVEGFATTRHFPNFVCSHAWCSDGDSAIDPTWKDAGLEYYGVLFSLAYVCKTMAEKGSFGVLENWECQHPLLRGVDEN